MGLFMSLSNLNFVRVVYLNLNSTQVRPKYLGQDQVNLICRYNISMLTFLGNLNIIVKL